MTLLQQLLSSNNGAIVQQLAGQFGLNQSQTQSAMQQLVPLLSRGIQQNTQQESGLQSLLGALQKGSHQQYVEQPEQLAAANTVQDGNNILGHIFGNKDVSRAVAGHAAAKTGVDNSILKQMLPILGTVVMGMLSQQSNGNQSNSKPLLSGLMGMLGGGAQQSSHSNMIGMLNGFLDADKDGSALDDIMGMLSAKEAG